MVKPQLAHSLLCAWRHCNLQEAGILDWQHLS